MRTIMLTAAAALAFAAVPAAADSAQTCAVAPAKLRSLASGAEADVARKAERNIALGEALCDARNRSEAAKKFNLAAKALGTELTAVMASGTTAAAN